ncbi:hypothetical protein LTR36_005769 [Oleoguttula mirabilis]|uniref:Uncharacterized protein n=1 Tax=Oleoguttula mirabilis TaxID=1507867 RepID=A0AAV9JEL9_9PEZI|nr:hypothetical protein LTR36_005769 [Oleoguttula mirabilis]
MSAPQSNNFQQRLAQLNNRLAQPQEAVPGTTPTPQEVVPVTVPTQSSVSRFRIEHLHHRITQAVALKASVSVRLEKAKKVFIAADEANIAAVTKVLDFKASKPDGNEDEGLSKGAAGYFKHARRAQKVTQEKCEMAIAELEALQYEYAAASITVRYAKRELRDMQEQKAEER